MRRRALRDDPAVARPDAAAPPRLAAALHVREGAAHCRADTWLQRGAGLPRRGFA